MVKNYPLSKYLQEWDIRVSMVGSVNKIWYSFSGYYKGPTNKVIIR